STSSAPGGRRATENSPRPACSRDPARSGRPSSRRPSRPAAGISWSLLFRRPVEAYPWTTNGPDRDRHLGLTALRVPLEPAEVEQDATLVLDPGIVPRRHVECVAGSDVALGGVVHAHGTLVFVSAAGVVG